MKLIIEISEQIYKQSCVLANIDGSPILKAIKNGVPLLKEHGKLIILSEDAIKREQTSLSFSCQSWISEVGLSNATVAIIEADKAESEE